MMNSSIVAASCSNLAAKLLEDSRCTEESRLARACHSILGRPAEPEEIEEWSRFLETYETTANSSGQDKSACRRKAWEGLCRALMSSNEFLYVE
jgi:hypothetical protein